MTLQIGKYNKCTPRSKITYMNVPRDLKGWVKAKEFIPIPFDLVLIKDENENIIHGWHTGHMWDGLLKNKKFIVTFWKRYHED